jgi:hypothetical protein
VLEVKVKLFIGAKKMAQLRSKNVDEIDSWPQLLAIIATFRMCALIVNGKQNQFECVSVLCILSVCECLFVVELKREREREWGREREREERKRKINERGRRRERRIRVNKRVQR